MDPIYYLRSYSDAVLSQQPSPKNFLQTFLSTILTNIAQIHRDFLKKTAEKKFAKKILGLGCCDKTASENDFRFRKFCLKSWLRAVLLRQTNVNTIAVFPKEKLLRSFFYAY